MLNRFQFARLRGFRRGKKRAAAEEARRRDEEKRREAAPQRSLTREVEGGGDRGSTETPSNGATSGRADGGITDGWSGNERIEGLLRRHQEQRGLLSPETLGLENGAAREAVPPPPTSEQEVDPVQEAIEAGYSPRPEDEPAGSLAGGLLAVFPGVAVHGLGHWYVGDGPTALRLLLAEVVGVALIAGIPA